MHLEREFFRRAGLDIGSISFGGARGAPSDYTTPRMTVTLLRYLSTRPDFSAFERALPILGVDGTLADDVPKTSSALGKVNAKTGTLLWENLLDDHFLVTSKALAGYLTTKSNRQLVFSFVVTGIAIDQAAETKTVAKTLAHLCEIVHQAN